MDQNEYHDMLAMRVERVIEKWPNVAALLAGLSHDFLWEINDLFENFVREKGAMK